MGLRCCLVTNSHYRFNCDDFGRLSNMSNVRLAAQQVVKCQIDYRLFKTQNSSLVNPLLLYCFPDIFQVNYSSVFIMTFERKDLT